MVILMEKKQKIVIAIASVAVLIICTFSAFGAAGTSGRACSGPKEWAPGGSYVCRCLNDRPCEQTEACLSAFYGDRSERINDR